MLDFFQIQLLKDSAKDFKLIYFNVDGEEYVFRTLGFSEYDNIMGIAKTEDELEELVCQASLVYPEDIQFAYGLAGLPRMFCPEVLHVSGFGSNSTDMILSYYNSYKQLMNTSKYSCMATVKAAMQDITLEEMEDWDWNKLLKYTTASEKILELLGHEIEMINGNGEVSEQEKPTDLQLIASGYDLVAEAGESKNHYFDFPLIGGQHWDNEDVLYEIRRQMGRRKR